MRTDGQTDGHDKANRRFLQLCEERLNIRKQRKFFYLRSELAALSNIADINLKKSLYLKLTRLLSAGILPLLILKLPQ
jgi:hypothetical protein